MKTLCKILLAIVIVVSTIAFFIWEHQNDLADEGRKIIEGAQMIGVTKYEFATMKSYANAAGASEYEIEKAYEALTKGKTTVNELCKKWGERAKQADLERFRAHNMAAISAAEK